MLYLVTPLFGFGLRQVIGAGAEDVAGAIQKQFRDHGKALPRALERAHDRTWQAFAVALAGDSVLDRVKLVFASGDDKGVREQVQQFLKGHAAVFHGTPADFRQACLDDLKRLRKSGRLSESELPVEIGKRGAGFWPADPNDLVEEARRAVAQVADSLAADYVNLASLLRSPSPTGPPLLAAAFCYFFRREVETDDELAHGLFFDGIRQLTAAQAKSFSEVGKAIATMGHRFDDLFEQMDRIEAVVNETQAAAVATHGAVLDLQAEMQRLGEMHLASVDEIRSLFALVQQQLMQAGMSRGEVRAHSSFSIRSADERSAVNALLVRFRALPVDERTKVPALLNGLGKLQVGAGEFAGARETFSEVATTVGDAAAKAEASFNAYRAALEERKWDTALEAIRQAASLDPPRFTPFPLHRFAPKRILGAGGFGTAILCHDHHFDEEVVVKTLHAVDLERGVDDVFREARLLHRLSHSSIIGVRDCEYADPRAKARPYLVMDYFHGNNLDQYISEWGTLTPEQLIPIAVQIAQGMHAAHSQGVLHRDLKPANVLVSLAKDGWRIKIIDFGLALRKSAVDHSISRDPAGNSIMSQSVAGTLLYAPPEQMGRVPGVKVGAYSDVYSFGKTCCFAMFKTTEPRSRHLASLPKELGDLLERCIEQDWTERPPDFATVLAALNALNPARRREEEEKAKREREQREQAERRQREAEKQRLADEQRRAEEKRRADERQRRDRDSAAQQRLEQERQQKDLVKRQREGEEKLARLVRAAFDRTNGHPTAADSADANALVKQYGVDTARANAIVADVQQQWQKEKARPPRPGEVVNVPLAAGLDMRFVWVPPGLFVMGSAKGEPERSDDEVQHRVQLTAGFFLATYPVSQAQWRAVMGHNPSHFKQDQLPVEQVTWTDCQEFCRRLAAKTGKRFRLPTEAEWEYACRAGTTTPFSFGPFVTTYQANFDGTLPYDKGQTFATRTSTTALGHFPPNPWGLADMHGNVWEWCQDLYGDYPKVDVTDPAGSKTGTTRVLRGGSWCDGPRYCRSAYRYQATPNSTNKNIGCRVVLVGG